MKANFDSIIASNTPVIVDFFAEWCGPCKSQSPILGEFAREMGDRVTVIKVDVDKNPAISQRYSIQSVPTIMIFQNGETKFRKSGMLSKGQLATAVINNCK